MEQQRLDDHVKPEPEPQSEQHWHRGDVSTFLSGKFPAIPLEIALPLVLHKRSDRFQFASGSEVDVALEASFEVAQRGFWIHLWPEECFSDYSLVAVVSGKSPSWVGLDSVDHAFYLRTVHTPLHEMSRQISGRKRGFLVGMPRACG